MGCVCGELALHRKPLRKTIEGPIDGGDERRDFARKAFIRKPHVRRAWADRGGLLHDIGYVRGVLRGDTDAEFVVDEGGKTVTLPRGASDAALMP